MPKATTPIDSFDLQILSELHRDGSQPISTIAKRIGRKRQFVQYRIQKLQEANILQSICAIVRTFALGFSTYNFLISLRSATNKDLERLEAFLVKSAAVKFIARTLGAWEYEVTAMASSPIELNTFIDDLQHSADDIIEANGFHTRTKTVKFEDLSAITQPKKAQTFVAVPKKKKRHKKRKHQLDMFDFHILYYVSKDATLSIGELARLCRISPAQARYRVTEMKKHNIITGTHAVINTQYFGYDRYSIVLNVANKNTKQEQELRTYIKQNNNISFAVKTLGQWDYRLQVLCHDQRELQNVITDLRDVLKKDLIAYAFALFTKELKRTSFPLKMSKNKMRKLRL